MTKLSFIHTHMQLSPAINILVFHWLLPLMVYIQKQWSMQYFVVFEGTSSSLAKMAEKSSHIERKV